ncbi:MAG: hypothetical protein JWO67_754 [Streptosporangiaceae bacterium]|nr:hypothetical protein [Streptosporangiaceae bacterium]
MSGFKPSHSGFGEFLRGHELQGEMRKRAERIAAAAESIAPEGPPGDKHRGEYRASFEVTSGVIQDVKGGLRAYGRVRNSAPHAAAVEYGYGGRSGVAGKSAHHVLGRAIDAAKE